MYDTRFNRFSGIISIAMTVIFFSAFGQNTVGRFLLWRNNAESTIGGNASVYSIERSSYFKPLKADYVLGKYKIAYDHSALWNWSTHEHFVYLVINYNAPGTTFNSVVAWDEIVVKPEESQRSEIIIDGEYPVM